MKKNCSYPINIILNSKEGDEVSMKEWAIKDEEPRRVDVQFKNKIYSLVLDDGMAFVEVYGTKRNKRNNEIELGSLETTRLLSNS